MKIDKYVGTIINNYHIDSLSKVKSKDGHKLYNCTCIKCGYRKFNYRINDIKKRINNNCEHYDNCVSWYSTRLRSIYRSMIDRCYNEKCKSFRFYGANKISICDEWLNSKQSFNNWAVNNGYSDNLTIDRIDPDGNYEPSNCRWVTRIYNSKWKSTTSRIEVNGIIDSGKGWSKRLGLGINFINSYIRKNGMEECKSFIKNNFKST